MRGANGLTGTIALVIAAVLVVGCSTPQAQRGPDFVEATLAAPQDRVKAAVIQVLTEGGYTINNGGDPDRVVSAGYRQEIDSPWNWLLVSRFGVSRSQVEAALVPEKETVEPATRLTIEVTHQGKGSLFSSWRTYDTPLPQSAANQLRLVKNALGLL
ncbi:MAG TPA: hypothetical protein VFL31_00780 [Nitrospiraceae bacterium]|nr:hypothetical protein [Nitrospiraceae bacterium]